MKTATALAWLPGVLLSVILIAGCSTSPKHTEVYGNWPAGSSPTEVGKRVAERFVPAKHLAGDRIIYPEACVWYGALTFAKLSDDKDLSNRLIRRFDPILTPKEAKLIPYGKHHVDDSVFGIVPLELAIETKDPRYLKIGKACADQQWEKPTAEGLTGETRFWIDDMFMITALQVQTYRATGEAKYIDRAALEMVAYLDGLQQTNGLFYHAPDVPFYWGRGNGWFAVGMAELLRSLPQDHPHRSRIMAGYKLMMASLLKYQNTDGMWLQLLDKQESWPETSGTAMFTFAMITGVKNGWLEEQTYGQASRKAWLKLVSYMSTDGAIREVCEGTNKKNSLEYYLTRGRRVGDYHGQAPMLWCASALLR